MAYETGTYSSGSDLDSKWRTFAAANGWTVNAAASNGYVFEKGTVFCASHFNSLVFNFRGCTSFNGGLDAFAQPGNSGVTHSCDVTGAGVAYHFFAVQEEGKDLLAAVIEKSAGVFRHWIICDLIKFGSYTGGTYTDSVNWTTATSGSNMNFPDNSNSRVIADCVDSSIPHGHVRVDYDGKGPPNWQQIRGVSVFATTACGGSVRAGSANAKQVAIGWPRYNERIVGVPITLTANRSDNLRSLIGRVPAMRWVNTTDYIPGELITIGPDTWQIFPIIQFTAVHSQSPSSIPSSGHYGYMYRR